VIIDSAYGMLASEFVEIFKKTVEGKGCSEWFDSLLQGGRPPIWQCPEIVRLVHAALTAEGDN
jgi:antibiotic biosynthesis monooxygenase (ABM) superfamily enzyme